MSHKSGFVSIIGKPNVGKSTLMNGLVNEKLSIITSKAQTTRHRIMGIISGKDFQIVYSDTPGVLNPKYPLQASMMKFVYSSLEDADVILFVLDPFEDFDEEDPFFKKLKKINVPIIFILNKEDLAKEGSKKALYDQKFEEWKTRINATAYLKASALQKEGLNEIIITIKKELPEHPAYFPKDQLTDKPERFFVTEIIREKIFTNYKKEVPYSCEIEVEAFKEEEKIIRIAVIIYVERKSQKSIIIGKNGTQLKKVGTAARLDMEAFFDKKVFLETYVKVAEDWRKKSVQLKRFGYN